MADDVDRTSERMLNEEVFLRKASRRPEGPIPTGRCLYCDDIVGDAMRWCSDECSHDWQAERAALQRAGRL